MYIMRMHRSQSCLPHAAATAGSRRLASALSHRTQSSSASDVPRAHQLTVQPVSACAREVLVVAARMVAAWMVAAHAARRALHARELRLAEAPAEARREARRDGRRRQRGGDGGGVEVASALDVAGDGDRAESVAAQHAQQKQRTGEAG